MSDNERKWGSIRRANSLLISTGNIINLNELKRKTTQNATDELTESLALTLMRSMQQEKDIPFDESNKLVRCRAPPPISDGKEEPRKDLKITVKIFLQSPEHGVLKDALENVLMELNTDYVELVIIAFPCDSQGSPLSDEIIQPIWRVLEDYMQKKRILSIGVSDLDTDQLIRLYEWAKIKPSVNHVNLSSCCVMPAEMTAFAKVKDIQLLTHNDPKDIIPKDQIPRIFEKVGSPTSNHQWQANWVARYSAMIKGRGVIHKKGFVALLVHSQ